MVTVGLVMPSPPDMAHTDTGTGTGGGGIGGGGEVWGGARSEV